MDTIVEMTITILVDNVLFNASVRPTGEYVIYGPVWKNDGAETVLAVGKLNFGYAMPGMCKALADLIRIKLKS